MKDKEIIAELRKSLDEILMEKSEVEAKYEDQKEAISLLSDALNEAIGDLVALQEKYEELTYKYAG